MKNFEFFLLDCALNEIWSKYRCSFLPWFNDLAQIGEFCRALMIVFFNIFFLVAKHSRDKRDSQSLMNHL